MSRYIWVLLLLAAVAHFLFPRLSSMLGGSRVLEEAVTALGRSLLG